MRGEGETLHWWACEGKSRGACVVVRLWFRVWFRGLFRREWRKCKAPNAYRGAGCHIEMGPTRSRMPYRATADHFTDHFTAGFLPSRRNWLRPSADMGIKRCVLRSIAWLMTPPRAVRFGRDVHVCPHNHIAHWRGRAHGGSCSYILAWRGAWRQGIAYWVQCGRGCRGCGVWRHRSQLARLSQAGHRF
jgi:hypothetical protein